MKYKRTELRYNNNWQQYYYSSFTQKSIIMMNKYYYYIYSRGGDCDKYQVIILYNIEGKKTCRNVNNIRKDSIISFC